jgi:hypothetical protein
MSRVKVGDWARSITVQGHSVFGFVTEVMDDDGWCKLFILKSPLKTTLHKEAFVPYKDTRVMRKVTLDAPGHYLNLIDIALDEKDEETFHALMRAYKAIKKYWRSKNGKSS